MKNSTQRYETAEGVFLVEQVHSHQWVGWFEDNQGDEYIAETKS